MGLTIRDNNKLFELAKVYLDTYKQCKGLLDSLHTQLDTPIAVAPKLRLYINSQNPTSRTADTIRIVQACLDTLEDEIRYVEGFEHFRLPPSRSKIKVMAGSVLIVASMSQLMPATR